MDMAEGPHVGVHGCPFVEVAVLSSLKQVLTSTVVRELVEDPGAVLHLGRVNLPEVPAVGQVVHIISALQHLTAEVGLLIDTNPEHSGGLKDEDQELKLPFCQHSVKISLKYRILVVLSTYTMLCVFLFLHFLAL